MKTNPYGIILLEKQRLGLKFHKIILIPPEEETSVSHSYVHRSRSDYLKGIVVQNVIYFYDFYLLRALFYGL